MCILKLFKHLVNLSNEENADAATLLAEKDIAAIYCAYMLQLRNKPSTALTSAEDELLHLLAYSQCNVASLVQEDKDMKQAWPRSLRMIIKTPIEATTHLKILLT